MDVIRSVPISAEQIRALESLERALFGLAADFQRDMGDGDQSAAGLYRLWSTLGAITTMWKEQADDPAHAEQQRRALAVIAAHEPNGDFEQAYRELQTIARAVSD